MNAFEQFVTSDTWPKVEPEPMTMEEFQKMLDGMFNQPTRPAYAYTTARQLARWRLDELAKNDSMPEEGEWYALEDGMAYRPGDGCGWISAETWHPFRWEGK